MRTVLAVLASLAAGWMLASLRSDRVAAAPVVDREIARPVAPGTGVSGAGSGGPAFPSGRRAERPPAERQDRSSPDAGPAPAEAVDLLGEALREYARRGIDRGWRAARGEPVPEEHVAAGMRRFEERTLALPEEIGRELAERETRRERAEEDPLALLERIEADGAGPVLELASEPEAMEALLARETAEHAAALDAPDPSPHVADGVTLAYPAGVFELENFLAKARPFPRDVMLAGAGRDATLFVLREGLGARDPLRRFAVRDATVFTDGNHLFDHRGGHAALVLERVRVIGFDTGAGGSSALAFADGLIVLARDVRFEGGYGRSPAHGSLFDVRTPALVARFERCTFSDLSLELHHARAGATLVFAHSRLENLLDDPLAAAAGRAGIVFPGSTVELREAGSPVPRRDPDDLFPAWREALGR